MTIFYDHLINLYELHDEFDKYDLAVPIRNDLMRLIDSAVHHEVFSLIMLELHPDHHEYFLQILSSDPSDRSVLTYLMEKSPGIDERIRQKGSEVKRLFTEDMRSMQ